MRLINEILTLLLGYKYRVVILKDRGVERYWVCSYIFEDTPHGNARLKKYLDGLEESVKAHTYYETVSFRSRKPYAGILIEELREKQKLSSGMKDFGKELRRYADGQKREE